MREKLMAEDYHMLSYIHEGPLALKKTFQENEAAIESIASEARRRNIQRIILTGLGSSYTSCMMAAPLFTYHCPVPVSISQSNELDYYQQKWIDQKTLLVVVSRSGERGPVVDAVKMGAGRGALCIAVTGVADSLLAQSSPLTLITQEGPEITFPKTKSVLCCAGLLMRLGLALAPSGDGEVLDRLETLQRLPAVISQTILDVEPALRSMMPSIEKLELAAVCGSGSNIGVALEAAIKIQEAAYIPVRGESTAALIHGPAGALDPRWLVVPLITPFDQDLNRELLSLVRKFRAHSLCIISQGVELSDLCDHTVQVAGTPDPLLSALVYLPPIQLLAYLWTVARNMNPDAPASMMDILDKILPPGRKEPELH